MNHTKLTSEQWASFQRLEQSLQALWEWIEELSPTDDKDLLKIVQSKITDLNKKLDKRMKETSTCPNCSLQESTNGHCPNCECPLMPVISN